MVLKIVRQYYVKIRDVFKSLALKWNGINSVILLKGKSPSWSSMGAGYSEQGQWVSGWKGAKILMNQPIPNKIKKTITKNYTGDTDEINQIILEESTRIHTLGNENYIRNSVKNLNNISHAKIGVSEGLIKTDIKEKGVKTDINLANLKLKSENKDLQELFDKNNGVKKYSQLSNTTEDVENGQQLLNYPYQTSALNVVNSSVKSTDVLTYNVNENYKLDENEIVKYNDYEEINNVLNKINTCLSKRNNWFDSNGRCQLSCQVNCQHSCQLSCQACNRKMCHNQHCGSV